MLGILLVRQYDLPSYGMEELEVDYAFVIFMKCMRRGKLEELKFQPISIRSCDFESRVGLKLFTGFSQLLFSSDNSVLMTAPGKNRFFDVRIESCLDFAVCVYILYTHITRARPHNGLDVSWVIFIVRSVGDQNQTAFSRAASTPPWCSVQSSSRTIYTTNILGLPFCGLNYEVSQLIVASRSTRLPLHRRGGCGNGTAA